MIRVLHILGGLYAGGMESMIMNYYRSIDRNKVQFDFLVFSGKAFFDDEVSSLGGIIYRMTPRRVNPLKNYIELDLFFRNNSKYEIIHVHQGINYFAPLVKAQKYNVPVRIVHSHGMSPELIKKQGFLYNLFTKPYINKLGTHFIACSENAAKQLFTLDRIENRAFSILPNAIDVNKFHSSLQSRLEIREKMNLKDNFVIGHIGNFTYPKNHKFIIEVFYQVYKNMKNARLILVGDGPEINQIKELVIKYELIEVVSFLGVRTDVYKIMNAFDRVIFPSHYEGLPVSLIEAQACGVKCCVSSNITDEVKITELIEYIELTESAEKWAEKIIKEGTKYNEDDLTKIIELKGYSIQKQAKNLEKYYYNAIYNM